MSLVVIPQIVEAKSCSKIMLLGHYTASIIAHYHISNMLAIFSICTLGDPQTSSLGQLDIKKILVNTGASVVDPLSIHIW